MTIPLEFREVLVCDDIRREDNGKAILIGVYYGDIVVSQFPISMRLNYWLQGRVRPNAKPGTAQFKIEVRGQADEENTPVLIEATIEVPPPKATSGIMVLQSVPFTANSPGRLVISMQEDGEWAELMEKKISAADSAPSSTQT